MIVDGCLDLFGVPSGILDHINRLSRVESFFSHLPWEDIARNCRYKSGVFFIADVDDRVDRIPWVSITYTLSECSQSKLIQERVTHVCPVLCNGICPLVVLMIEADMCRSGVRMRESKHAPHRLVIGVPQMIEFNSQASDSRFKPLVFLCSWILTAQKHTEEIVETIYPVKGTDTGVTVDQGTICGSSNTGKEASNTV